MAGLPWIEVHNDLPRHPKSLHLGLLLGDDRAWTHMVQAWMWCAENRPDGRLTGTIAGQLVECAAGWKGKPGAFVEAAVAVGFVDEVDGGLEFHGWAERAAAHIAKREKDAERQRKRQTKIQGRYAEKPTASVVVLRDSQEPHAEITRDSRVSHAGVVRESRGNSNPNPNPNSEGESTSTAPPPPSKIPVPTLPLKPPDDPLADGASFFAAVQVERADAGLPREKPPHPRALSAWWSEALMELNGDAAPLVEAYKTYARDEFWRTKMPPLPFPGFMSQWRKYVPVRPAA